MGATYSQLSNRLWPKQLVQILMVGLGDGGKTTALFKLKTGEVVKTIPTVGFIVETLDWKDYQFTIWDLGGSTKTPQIEHYSWRDCRCVIFVVDSTDRERMGDAKAELQRVLKRDDLNDAVLLVLANKQDLPDVMTVPEIKNGLGLITGSDRKWLVQSTCATSGEGLNDALEWLADALSKKSTAAQEPSSFFKAGSSSTTVKAKTLVTVSEKHDGESSERKSQTRLISNSIQSKHTVRTVSSADR